MGKCAAVVAAKQRFAKRVLGAKKYRVIPDFKALPLIFL
jgi:hypothetical protein